MLIAILLMVICCGAVLPTYRLAHLICFVTALGISMDVQVFDSDLVRDD